MFQAKVGSFNANTSTGDQAVTGVGFQPEALILTVIGNVTGAGSNSTCIFEMGVSDGTASRCVGSVIEGGYLSLTANRHDESSLLRHQTGASGSYDAAASLVSFDPDGWTMNWSDAPGSAIEICYVAVAGLAGVDVGTFALNTSPGNQAVTGVGFAADALFMIGANQNAAGIGGSATVGFGWTRPEDEAGDQVHKHGTAQAGSGGVLYQSYTGFDVSAGVYGKMVRYVDTTGAVDTDGPVLSIDSDGFTIDVDQGGASTRRQHWLALHGQTCHIGSEAVPNSTGIQSVNIGFRPGLILFTWTPEDYDAGGGSDDDFVVGIGAYDGTDQWGGSATDGWSSSKSPAFYNVARSELSLTQAICQVDPWGVTDFKATVDGFTDNGFDLNWTAVGAGTGRFGWIAFGPVQPDFTPQIIRYQLTH